MKKTAIALAVALFAGSAVAGPTMDRYGDDAGKLTVPTTDGYVETNGNIRFLFTDEQPYTAKARKVFRNVDAAEAALYANLVSDGSDCEIQSATQGWFWTTDWDVTVNYNAAKERVVIDVVCRNLEIMPR